MKRKNHDAKRKKKKILQERLNIIDLLNYRLIYRYRVKYGAYRANKILGCACSVHTNLGLQTKKIPVVTCELLNFSSRN
jgi:hypothetical protein